MPSLLPILSYQYLIYQKKIVRQKKHLTFNVTLEFPHLPALGIVLFEEDDNSRELLLLAEHTRFFDHFAVKFVNFDFNFIST